MMKNQMKPPHHGTSVVGWLIEGGKRDEEDFEEELPEIYYGPLG